MLGGIFATLMTTAGAAFPENFPPRDVAEINEIVTAFERGRVPHYSSPMRWLPGDDEVEAWGQPVGILAGLQLHASKCKPEVRRAMVEAVARLTVAIFDLGARHGDSNDPSLEEARIYLSNILTAEPAGPVDFNAIRVLMSIAQGRRLKSLAETAREGLKSITTAVENILLQRGLYRKIGAIDHEDLETMMGLVLEVDERAGLATLKKLAESKLPYAAMARRNIYFRMWDVDQNRAWRLCHEALVDIIDKKAAKGPRVRTRGG